MSEQPWIDNPISYVDSLLQNYMNDPEVQTPKELLRLFIDSFYHRLLGSETKLALHNGTHHLVEQNLFNGKLCVLRGMVQDIGESELFIVKYRHLSKSCSETKVSSTFLRDSTVFPEDCDFSRENVDYGDRLSLIVTSVPGESSWVTEYLGQKYEICNHGIGDGYGKASKVGRYDEAMPLSIEVKFYGSEKNIVINNVYEFVGVFEQLPANNNEPCDESAMMCNENHGDFITNRSGFVFHALFAKPSQLSEMGERLNFKAESSSETLLQQRNLFIDLLSTTCFKGDSNIAEWTLLNIISAVYKRADVIPLGKLCLNVKGCVSDVVARFREVTQSVVPAVACIDLSVEALNNSKLVPHKDMDTMVLHTGKLQLSPGTLLIINETQLQPGTLNETGLKNLSALTSLVQSQKLLYDFKFQNVEILCDYNIIVFSETSSLIKHFDAVQNLKPSDSNDQINNNFECRKNEVAALPNYFAFIKNLPYHVPVNMSNVAQKHFVETRQSNKKYTADDFHHLLNVARLVSLSFGRTELSNECWQKALSLVESESVEPNGQSES